MTLADLWGRSVGLHPVADQCPHRPLSWYEVRCDEAVAAPRRQTLRPLQALRPAAGDSRARVRPHRRPRSHGPWPSMVIARRTCHQGMQLPSTVRRERRRRFENVCRSAEIVRHEVAGLRCAALPQRSCSSAGRCVDMAKQQASITRLGTWAPAVVNCAHG
eukprot:366512-Chlamydomonas_euryale.AAC.12